MFESVLKPPLERKLFWLETEHLFGVSAIKEELPSTRKALNESFLFVS